LSDPANQRTEKCPALKINELRIVRPCKFHELRNVRTENCPATLIHRAINSGSAASDKQGIKIPDIP